MRGLEKERNKGNKEPQRNKGMRVRVNRVWKKNQIRIELLRKPPLTDCKDTIFTINTIT